LHSVYGVSLPLPCTKQLILPVLYAIANIELVALIPVLDVVCSVEQLTAKVLVVRLLHFEQAESQVVLGFTEFTKTTDIPASRDGLDGLVRYCDWHVVPLSGLSLWITERLFSSWAIRLAGDCWCGVHIF